MRFIKFFAVFGVLFCILTTSSLLLWPSSTEAKEHSQSNSNTALVSDGAPTGGNSPSAKVIAGLQGGQPIGPGVIYAPRDVVDMTRLVLESSRDQTSHLAHYIEHATTVIVVFFSLLGAVGAAFGLHKIHDIEDRAKEAVNKFKEDLQKSTNGVEAEFRKDIDAASLKLNREINDQTELLAAKAEINQAGSNAFMLKNAARRIKKVLDRKEVSTQARIRGLADYAYAVKRTGDVDEALVYVAEAADLAKNSEPTMFPLLAFNASCYASILGNSLNAIDWLTQAIAKHPEYKESAKKDADFDKIRNLPEFVTLTA